jgi:hypothetical protein
MTDNATPTPGTLTRTSGAHRVEAIGRRPVMRAVVATVISDKGERLADFRHAGDANLFAAAPALLNALEKARETLVRIAGRDFDCMPHQHGMAAAGHAQTALHDVEAALTTAGGRNG